MRPSVETTALLDELMEESENYQDVELPDVLPPHVKVTRRGVRNSPVSIRLSDMERTALEEAARSHGVGASTMARELITHGLAIEDEPLVPLSRVREIVSEAIKPLVQRIDALPRTA